MLELGQPIHAFDYDKVRNHAVTVRRAREGETLRTLDGQDRTFTEGQLVIADERGPIAIAGVMGGFDTEVTDDTKTILLEVANFDAVSVRRTAMALKLQSEASKRFAWGHRARARADRLPSRHAAPRRARLRTGGEGAGGRLSGARADAARVASEGTHRAASPASTRTSTRSRRRFGRSASP